MKILGGRLGHCARERRIDRRSFVVDQSSSSACTATWPETRACPRVSFVQTASDEVVFVGLTLPKTTLSLRPLIPPCALMLATSALYASG